MFKLLDIEGVKELHFLVKGLNYSIILYIKSDWEKTQLRYLINNINEHDAESVCGWCNNHDIIYQIIGSSRKTIIRKPCRYIKYIILKSRL